MSKKHVLVEYLNDLNNTVHQPLQATQRIKYTSFDVSSKYLLFGATSGGIYVFQRNPCEFIKLLPSKEGAISSVNISPDEKTIAACTLKGHILLFQNYITETFVKPKIYTDLEGNVITALKWFRNTLYCGDNSGKISVINVKNTLATAIFQSSFYCMVTLESPILQIDTINKYVLISTKTRAILVDTDSGQFCQIGKKLRDGHYGACFHDPNGKAAAKIVPTPEKKFLNLGLDELYEDDPLDDDVRIFCARPGCRLWEANFEPNVICTHQFKSSLSQFPSRIISMEEEEDHRLNLVETCEDDYVSPDNISFEKVYSFDNKFIITFNSEGFYILDVRQVSVLFWSNKYKNIKDIKLYKNAMYIWHGSANYNVVCLFELENLILDTLFHKKYYICSELCHYFMNEIIYLLESSERIRLILYLKKKLDEFDNTELLEKLNPIFNKIEALNEEQTQNVEIPAKNGLVVVENNYYLESKRLEEFENNMQNNMQDIPETIQTLIEIGTTVTEKISEGTQNVLEKLHILQDTVINLTVNDNNANLSSFDNTALPNVDKSISNGDKMISNGNEPINNFKTHENNFIIPVTDGINLSNASDSSIQENIVDNFIEKDDNFLVEVTQENNGTFTTDTLYKCYQLGKGNPNVSIPKLSEHFASIDIIKAISLFESFTAQFENSTNCNQNDMKLWYYKQYLRYFSTVDFDGTISNLGLQSDGFKFLMISFNAFNKSDSSCECSFPLPSAKLEVPKFYEIGCSLLKAIWNSSENSNIYSNCNIYSDSNNCENTNMNKVNSNLHEEFLRQHPYYWKYFLCNLKVEENVTTTLLPLIVQYNDKELFNFFMYKFHYDAWEDSVKLFVKLKKGLCLNCDRNFSLVKGGGIFSWTEMGKILVQSMGGPISVKLLMRYSNYIPAGELGMEFYQSCLFLESFEEKQERVRKKCVQFVEDASQGHNVNKWNSLIVDYLRRDKTEAIVNPYENKVPSSPSFTCTNCDLPLVTAMMPEFSRANCGHLYHKFCLLNRLKSMCKVCNVSVIYPNKF